MKKSLSALVMLAVTTSVAQADTFVAMPVAKDGWAPNFTLAATAGYMDFADDAIDSDTALGLQLSFDCMLLGTTTGKMRQQFNVNRFDEQGVEITTFELNPHWYTGSSGLTFGFGPGIGYVQVDAGGDTTGLWALQLGAAAEYRAGMFFAGLSTRYQFTESKDFGGGTEEDVNNLLTQAKVGVNF